MKSRVTRNDISVIGAAAAALIVAGMVAASISGRASIIFFGVLCVVVVLWAQFESMRRTSEQLLQMQKVAFDDYRQIESLLSLIATLEPERPLPPLRDYAASPDFLRYAISLMLERRPRIVVEVGSGSSTVFLAYCLKKLGGGKLISLDHEVEFAERTRTMLQLHGLSEYVTVLYAPLEDVRIEGSDYRWYTLKDFHPGGSVDILIIDGPPYHVHPLARYPAIPLLLPHMSAEFVALMDDAIRPEEVRITKRWKNEFPDLAISVLEAEKGALLMSRSAPGSTDRAAREV